MAESETNPPKGDRVGKDFTYGNNPNPGGDIDTSDSVLPPYEGRKGATEPADAPPPGADANIEGGTRPTYASGGLTHEDPANTPGGRTASPADERPPETVNVTEPGQDYSGSGQAHTPGVTKGEDQAATEAEGSEREGKRPAGSVEGSTHVDHDEEITSSGTVDMPPA